MMESPMTRNCHVGFGERYEETRQLKDWKVRSVPTPFSPLLANIALHGLVEHLYEYIVTVPLRNPGGKSMGKDSKISSLTFIRYADDFVGAT